MFLILSEELRYHKQHKHTARFYPHVVVEQEEEQGDPQRYLMSVLTRGIKLWMRIGQIR